MHIGHEIQKELKRQGRSATWLADKIPCFRTNVYNIFMRKSIDTDLLLRISEILDFNFFTLYVRPNDENDDLS